MTSCIDFQGNPIENERVNNCAFPVKNQRKFISARCIGTIYCNVRVLTDGYIL